MISTFDLPRLFKDQLNFQNFYLVSFNRSFEKREYLLLFVVMFFSNEILQRLPLQFILSYLELENIVYNCIVSFNEFIEVGR